MGENFLRTAFIYPQMGKAADKGKRRKCNFRLIDAFDGDGAFQKSLLAEPVQPEQGEGEEEEEESDDEGDEGGEEGAAAGAAATPKKPTGSAKSVASSSSSKDDLAPPPPNTKLRRLSTNALKSILAANLGRPKASTKSQTAGAKAMPRRVRHNTTVS